MSICSYCQGRGTWQETAHSKDGTIEFVWRECGHCDSTGLDNEDINDFDFGDDNDNEE